MSGDVDYGKPVGWACAHCGVVVWPSGLNSHCCCVARILPVYAEIPKGQRPVWRCRLHPRTDCGCGVENWALHEQEAKRQRGDV